MASIIGAQCPQPGLVLDRRYEHLANTAMLGAAPGAMVVDLDGAKGPDVVIANPLINPAEIFLNTGNGMLTRHDLTLPYWTYQGAAAGDFDHDGNIDIVVLRAGLTEMLTLRGDGRGNFQIEPFGTRCPDQFWGKSVACADFDGDGWVDLFIGMFDTYQSRVYLNDRQGRFVDATFSHLPWPVLGCVQRVVSADLDGDRDLDLALAVGGICGPKAENIVLLNDGRAHFTPVTLAGRRHWSFDVAVGDVTGDALPDLVYANAQDASELWINVGSGQFLDATTLIPTTAQESRFAATILDIDGDGRNDIVTGLLAATGYRLDSWINTGGSFASRPDRIQQPPNLQVYWLHSCDMDQDGDVDIVVGGHIPPPTAPYRDLRVFINTHRHTLPSLGPSLGRPWPIALYAKPGQLVFPALATSSVQFDLGSLGVLGLDPASLLLLGPIDMQQSCSRTLTLNVPNVQSLRGRSFSVQACVLDLANPADTRLTNWTTDTVQ